MAAVQEQDTALTDEGQKNMDAARSYSEKHTAVPYYVIAGVGILLLGFLIYRIVKTAKS